MSNQITKRLSELGVTLPSPAAPAANYVPYVISGNQLIISGNLPFGADGLEYVGKVGDDISLEDAQAAAKLCAINILAQANVALGGDLTRVKRLLRLGGFVNATADYTQQPAVINGASDFMVAVLGDAGKHARAAVGVASLPFGVSVEVDAIFEIE
ncbi:MAG: RidA family protein [OCS116 cluster bacterium]|uniref:Endoribonuclease L-PSP/chorismate mutase-like domain-containing protein n=1 Tax=OCS116 cluster bacterium TaxID=2030921 RepID=A0A2A4YUK7_9PROT|nr:RidA family protein [OCS116 cluster bacterium]